MDFFKLSKEEYYNFMSYLRFIEDEYKFRREGILIIAIENDIELLNDAFNKNLKINKDKLELLIKEYNKLDNKYLNIFDIFKDNCISNSNIYYDVDFAISNVEYNTKIFLNIDDDKINEFLNNKNDNFDSNLKLFNNLINDKDFNLIKLVEDINRYY